MCVTYNSTGLILNKKVHRATLNHSFKSAPVEMQSAARACSLVIIYFRGQITD